MNKDKIIATVLLLMIQLTGQQSSLDHLVNTPLQVIAVLDHPIPMSA